MFSVMEILAREDPDVETPPPDDTTTTTNAPPSPSSGKGGFFDSEIGKSVVGNVAGGTAGAVVGNLLDKIESLFKRDE